MVLTKLTNMLPFFNFKIRMRIRFVLRKSRLNKLGQCPLDCRVRVNGVPATPFSTSIMVAPIKWDSKAQRIKGASDLVNALNKKLDALRFALDSIRDMNMARGKRLSAKEIVDIYHGKREYVIRYLDLCQKKLDDLKNNGRAPATIGIHRKCHRYLFDYIGENLIVHDIEKRHVKGFWDSLKEKGYDHDYVNKTVSNCISLFTFAVDKDFADCNPFNGSRFTWKNKVDLTCLDIDEIERIKKYKWSDVLQKVVDAFLFMCYQGMHIGDYLKLNQANISSAMQVQWVRLGRQKTKVSARVPVHSEAAKIIEKYGGLKNIPKLTGQSSNDHLKTIAEKVDIPKHLTNKIARKTFTDMCLNEYGMSDESVAAMLGHTSTRFVKKYGAVTDRRILTEWKDKIEVA
jgi:site-specific recombinase XerD